MSKKHSRKQPAPSRKKQDSVVKEAWENMNADMAKIMPDFLAKRLQGRKNKVWVMVALTVVELLVLGVVGKFIYDWFVQ